MEEAAGFVGVPCESCRVTETRFRYGPCPMCRPLGPAHAASFSIVFDGACDHCGRKIGRGVQILWNHRCMVVGVDCFVSLERKGAILWRFDL